MELIKEIMGTALVLTVISIICAGVYAYAFIQLLML